VQTNTACIKLNGVSHVTILLFQLCWSVLQGDIGPSQGEQLQDRTENDARGVPALVERCLHLRQMVPSRQLPSNDTPRQQNGNRRTQVQLQRELLSCRPAQVDLYAFS